VRGRLVHSALIGALLVLPLMVAESATASGLPRTTFSPALFFMLWLFAAMFFLVLGHVVASLRHGSLARIGAASLVVRLAFLYFVARAWVSLVVDQMPCFLGASGC
jgi:hypothetical protein